MEESTSTGSNVGLGCATHDERFDQLEKAFPIQRNPHPPAATTLRLHHTNAQQGGMDRAGHRQKGVDLLVIKRWPWVMHTQDKR